MILLCSWLDLKGVKLAKLLDWVGCSELYLRSDFDEFNFDFYPTCASVKYYGRLFGLFLHKFCRLMNLL